MIGRRALLGGALSLTAVGASAQIIRPGMSPGVRPGFRFLGTGPALDADVAAYVAKLTTPPSVAERNLLNTLVTGLKSDNVWASLDRIGLLAVETQQAALVDLRNPAKGLTVGGTATFTANRGYQGDGSTGYLDIGETWNGSGNKFALNSASFGVWCNATVASGFKGQIGNVTNSPRSQISAMSSSGSNETFRINDSTEDVLMVSNGSRLGHRAASRTASNAKKGYFNGAAVASLTSASTAVNTTNGTVLRSATSYTDDRIAAFWSGAGLTDAQVSALHSRLSAYLTAKGAN